jgi:hypothetical protein
MGGFAAAVGVAMVVAFLPGAALLCALGIRRPVWLVALAAPCSVAVASWTGNIAALTGLPFGRFALGGVTLVLLAAGAIVALRGRSLRGIGGPLATTPNRASLLVRAGSAVLLGLAVLRSLRTWWSGLGGGIDTVPQEHDMVLHVVLTSFIARTGHGATWQLGPVDLLDGGPSFFYPAGFHLLAAVTAQLLGGDTVAGVNAMTVALVVFAATAGVGCLALVAARRAGLGREGAIVAATLAVVVATSLYRPTYQLVHDGGILANVAAFALVPGALAGVLAFRSFSWTRVVAVGVGCAGVVTVHPSAIASLGVTVVAWWVGEVLLRRERARVRAQVVPVVAAGVVAALLSSPTLLRAVGVSGRTTGFPVDSSRTPVPEAIGLTFGFPYGGYLDPSQSISQAVPAVLVVLAAVVLLVARRGWGPLMAWTGWTLVVLGRLVAPTSLVVAMITGFFYNAYLRVASHLAILAPVVIGIATVIAANVVVAWLRRRRVALPVQVVAAGLALLVALGYLAVPGRTYSAVDTEAVATRYAHPDFTRVDNDDIRAIDYLASVVRPGQRVMNSANDGSTYLYIDKGIPVVNIGTLGLDDEPYTYELLADFNHLGRDREVGRLVRDLDIRWVYVDSKAPTIGSGYSPGGWAKSSSYSTAPGLMGLDGVPGVTRVFTSGSVAVYAVSPAL